MKEISIEKTLTERKYEAVDGTLFDSKDECQRYENTARCVLLSKYNKLIIKSATEYDLFEMGSEETVIDLIKIKHTSDIPTIVQLVILDNDYLIKEQDRIDRMYEQLESAYNAGETFMVNRGYQDDYFWPLGSVENKIKQILSHCNG
jgi:hypothetical protein